MNNQKILILGNGFDLDFGSDTRYKTFAEGTLNEPFWKDSPLLHFLKRRFQNMPNKNWFNFENELAEYAKTITSEPDKEMIEADRKDFQKLFFIGEYMNTMGWKTWKEERKEYIEANRENLNNPIINPVQMWGYELSVANKVLHLIAEHPTHFSKIITFNYTNLYEYLKVAVDDITQHDDNKSQAILESINIIPIHIEKLSRYEKVPVLGIQEDAIVPAGYEFLKKKEQINSEKRKSAIDDIYNASELVIFGHALGESDSDYFRTLFRDMFSEHPSHSREIWIFTKGDGRDLWKRIQELSGQENIMPQKTCTKIHIIDTNVIESLLNYEAFLETF